VAKDTKKSPIPAPSSKTAGTMEFRPQGIFHPRRRLASIEKKMKGIINKRDPRAHRSLGPRPRESSITEDLNGTLIKVELINSIPATKPLRMYWHGELQEPSAVAPHLQQHRPKFPATRSN